MAAAKTLAIPELLEHILLDVSVDSLKTVFILKGVNKTWQGLIDTSIWLRRAMFLAPGGEVVKAAQNRDLMELAIDDDVLVSMSRPRYEDVSFTLPPHIATTHVREAIDQINLTEDRTLTQWMLCWGNIQDCRMSSSESERCVFITKPPIDTLLLQVRWGCKWDDDDDLHLDQYYVENSVTIYDPKGITIGTVVDTFDKMINWKSIPRDVRRLLESSNRNLWSISGTFQSTRVLSS